MKKLLTIILFLLIPVISMAQCVGNEGAVGFYNSDAIIIASAMVVGGGLIGGMRAIYAFVESGDAVLFEGKRVALLETRPLADGTLLVLCQLPNGRKIFTFDNMLRCR